jgi:hypothetical protein
VQGLRKHKACAELMLCRFDLPSDGVSVMKGVRSWIVVFLALLLALVLMGGRGALATGRAAYSPEGTQFSLAGANVAFLGEKENDWSGYSVAPAGDVNHDGYSDLLVGAPYAGPEIEKGPGKAYLILGRPRSLWPADHVNLLAADASFLGPRARYMAARQLYTAGDVNNDGYDDFLITCWHCGMRGVTWLYLGRENIDWGSDYPMEAADAKFWGEDTLDRAGYYAATAGDVNGDGYDDFLITAVGDEDGGGFRAGQTYLLLGRAEADWGWPFNLNRADASFAGEAEGDASGRSAAGVGDVDGDGLADLMIGAPFNDLGGVDAGKAYRSWGARRPTGAWIIHSHRRTPLSSARLLATNWGGASREREMSTAMAMPISFSARRTTIRRQWTPAKRISSLGSLEPGGAGTIR